MQTQKHSPFFFTSGFVRVAHWKLYQASCHLQC